MIVFFRALNSTLYAVEYAQPFDTQDYKKLIWLFGGAKPLEAKSVRGHFIGPRKEMITPWSTNAVEITQTMGIKGILRIEEFFEVSNALATHDRMLQRLYTELDQELFTIHHAPEPIFEIDDIKSFSEKEGLALSQEEINYLNDVSWKLGRKLTDSEVFGFSQVNSEHCRHKIFNGTFIIDGEEKKINTFSVDQKNLEGKPELHCISV
jgi:phosphoribosylformylglycinamidine synthase